jgi:hypothetical protein
MAGREDYINWSDRIAIKWKDRTYIVWFPHLETAAQINAEISITLFISIADQAGLSVTPAKSAYLTVTAPSPGSLDID